jgi:hypothetical protein
VDVEDTDGRDMPAACPACGSADVIAILYGLPGHEIFEQERAGEIELGGCIVFDDQPDWRCRTCGNGFA